MELKFYLTNKHYLCGLGSEKGYCITPEVDYEETTLARVAKQLSLDNLIQMLIHPKTLADNWKSIDTWIQTIALYLFESARNQTVVQILWYSLSAEKKLPDYDYFSPFARAWKNGLGANSDNTASGLVQYLKKLEVGCKSERFDLAGFWQASKLTTCLEKILSIYNWYRGPQRHCQHK